MRYKGTAALFVLAAMVFVPMANVAAEDTYAEIPISIPSGDSMDVAVYFADNMAFTPQWRLGNFIRIEIIILDVTGLTDPSELLIEETNVYTQEELRADPGLLFNTNMVSVPEIWINISSGSNTVVEWHSDFEDVSGEERTVIREINGEGHLIYGGKWDTSYPDSVEGGFYTVSVGLPSTYNVKWAVQHDRGVTEEPTEEVVLMSDDPVEEPAEAVGYMEIPDARGGVLSVTNEAYIILGEILDGSGSGANGGSDGGNSGGGNGYHGGKR